MEILIPIIAALVLVTVYAFYKLSAYSKECNFRDLVAWSVSEDNHIRANLSLSAYLSNAQIRLSIPREYCISGDIEAKFMHDIIAAYQKDLTNSFFKGNLTAIKSKYVVSGEAYFMYLLYIFLSDHQCDYDFIGHNMHKERIFYKEYGSLGSTHFDATFSLSDFAVAFHKLHYITYMYCRDSRILCDFVPDWTEKNLKDILDTKQIHISR